MYFILTVTSHNPFFKVMSSNNSTSSGTMFINQQPKPNQNYGMNNGMNETINMIRNHDSKDPKVRFPHIKSRKSKAQDV